MLLAGALGFAPIAYDIATRMPSQWARVARPPIIWRCSS